MRKLIYYLILVVIAQAEQDKKMNIKRNIKWCVSLNDTELNQLNNNKTIDIIIDGVSIEIGRRPIFPGPI